MEVKRIYEAMFLLDPGFAATWDRVEETIRGLMDRAAAELLYCKQWDERRLAYEIKGRKRGTYVLAFFKARTGAPASIERDVQISDGVLRVLVLKNEILTEEQIVELAKGPGLVAPKPLPDHRDRPGGYDRGPRRRDDDDRGFDGSDDRPRGPARRPMNPRPPVEAEGDEQS